jgi:hypothetical protein
MVDTDREILKCSEDQPTPPPFPLSLHKSRTNKSVMNPAPSMCEAGHQMWQGSLCYKTALYTGINPSNAELNPICHLLELLGAHHIFRVSRIRFKSSLPYSQNNAIRPYADARQKVECSPQNSWSVSVPYSSALQSPVIMYCQLLGAFSKLWKATVSFVMPVCPSAWNKSAPNWMDFSWKLKFEYFSKICQENSSFIQIWQE